jgi:two-component system KDP operon response regulator KdpE
VLSTTPGAELIAEVAQHEPDLLFLHTHDLHVCAKIRQQWQHLPIVILGSHHEEQGAVRALDQGADDYITQPFAQEELAARIRALLRRTQDILPGEPEPKLLRSHDGYLCMNVVRHEVVVGGHKVQLTRTEFALLQELMANAEKVLTHCMLLRKVWGPEYSDEDGYVRVYMRQLRRKIEPEPSHPRYILTEPGVGYVFRSPSRLEEGL